MSQPFKNGRLPLEGSASQVSGQPVSAAAEASIRQLIANGKQKIALEKAKEIHKAQHSAASEALLVDAYAARITSLMQQNLAVEAKSLLELVRERYPASRARLDQLTAPAVARAGDLAELVRPLSDPATTSERRMAIEQAIQRELWDLGALAQCAPLSSEDPLRQAAAALHRAFLAVTSGPVDEEALALPEVSRRSPLAPWKMLLRAIACFYRREDETCRKCLDAVQPDSAPARLVPAVHAMLGDKTGVPLTAASAALVSRTKEDSSALRNALDALDRSFASDDKSRILQAIRSAMQECRRSAPGLVERLLQHITVRSVMADLNPDKMAAAAGGNVRQNASSLRLMALGLEETKEEEKLAFATAMWNDFRIQAVREGWFAENGVEAAAIYLHIAELLRKFPREMIRELERNARRDGVDAIFLQPDTLYQRACAIDPHSEAFSRWMDWAKDEKRGKAERVAEAWHKAVPLDMTPLLYLMKAAERRSAFPAALKYLAKAERIDSVHTDVRKARLRLMAGNAIRQIQQKQYEAALKEVAQMHELPQSQQGDRPAFLAALRYTVNMARGKADQAAAHRAAIDWQLENRIAGGMLTFSVAAACKGAVPEKLGPVEKLAPAERSNLPAAMARVAELTEDMRITLSIPKPWLAESRKQLWQNRYSLNTGQLRTLAEAALRAKSPDLAYAASAAGLERGGPTEGRFLLLRAQSLPPWQFGRSEVCAAAAAALARQQRDTELIEEAVELLHGPLESDDFTVTLDQAAEVLKKEKAEPKLPGDGPGPDYSDILGDDFEDLEEDLCQCPDCRRRRGEIGEPEFELDDADVEELLQDIPDDVPPEIARMLLEETKRAVLNGESVDQLIARLTGGFNPGGAKKGRRK